MYYHLTLFAIPNPRYLLKKLTYNETWNVSRYLIKIFVATNRSLRCQLWALTLGRGARNRHGYGSTIFLAHNCLDRQRGTRLAWKIGITTSWKQIPYIDG